MIPFLPACNDSFSASLKWSHFYQLEMIPFLPAWNNSFSTSLKWFLFYQLEIIPFLPSWYDSFSTRTPRALWRVRAWLWCILVLKPSAGQLVSPPLTMERSGTVPYIERIRHGLINYIDTTAKCRLLKQLTCSGTLRQVLIRFYRLEIQSVLLVFST